MRNHTDCIEIGNDADVLLKSIRQFKKSRGESYGETAERIRAKYLSEAAELDRLETEWMTAGEY